MLDLGPAVKAGGLSTIINPWRAALARMFHVASFTSRDGDVFYHAWQADQSPCRYANVDGIHSIMHVCIIVQPDVNVVWSLHNGPVLVKDMQTPPPSKRAVLIFWSKLLRNEKKNSDFYLELWSILLTISKCF